MRKFSIIQTVVVGLMVVMAAPVGQSELGTVTRKYPIRPTMPVRKPKPKPYQVGTASWYGQRHHGRSTANGEIYDMFQLTAAHPRLPLGSLVRVTHLASRRSVIVRINDRGPSRENVIIDLSYAAARQLGVVRRGLARVRLDLVDRPAPVQVATRLSAD